jgi:hypothetical protein
MLDRISQSAKLSAEHAERRERDQKSASVAHDRDDIDAHVITICGGDASPSKNANDNVVSNPASKMLLGIGRTRRGRIEMDCATIDSACSD